MYKLKVVSQGWVPRLILKVWPQGRVLRSGTKVVSLCFVLMIGPTVGPQLGAQVWERRLGDKVWSLS